MILQLTALLMSLLAAFSMSLDSLAADLSPNGYLMLVNRDYQLSSSYVPEDLVYPNVKHSSSAYQMRADAAQAL